MARKTIREKIATLKRRFPRRTRYGFLYLNKKDLRTNYTTILVYALVYAPEHGHSLFIWNPHRKGMDWQSVRWNKWLNEKGIEILATDVMRAINDKRGDHWEMQRIIGFSGDDYKPRMHIAQEGKNALYPVRPRAKLSRNKSIAKRK